MSGIGTRTVEQITTRTFQEQVRRITRNVQTDLLELVESYPHQLTREDALEYIADFRAFMGELYLEYIEFRWTSPGTNEMYGGFKYIIVNKEAVRELDKPGGITYDPQLAQCNFTITIRRTDKWRASAETSKREFDKNKLKISWGPAQAVTYNKGRYVADDRSYGETSVAVNRMRFKRW
jgi:hypothetical protein